MHNIIISHFSVAFAFHHLPHLVSLSLVLLCLCQTRCGLQVTRSQAPWPRSHKEHFPQPFEEHPTSLYFAMASSISDWISWFWTLVWVDMLHSNWADLGCFKAMI